MKFLPLENITYKTKLSEEELIKRLSDSIEAPKPLRERIFNKDFNKPYHGKIEGRQFRISRNIKYQNSFLPIIKGSWEHDINGILITVKMRLSTYVFIFLCIWCGFVGLASLAFLLAMGNKSEFMPFGLIPLLMLLLAFGMTIGGFKYESGKSKKDLQEIFQADNKL